MFTVLFVPDVFDRFVYANYLNFLHNRFQHQHDDENNLGFQQGLIVEFQSVVPNISIVHLIETEYLMMKNYF